MPLSINVGLSRKASKDYQSTGVSINVTAELDQALLTKPDELQKQVGAIVVTRNNLNRLVALGAPRNGNVRTRRASSSPRGRVSSRSRLRRCSTNASGWEAFPRAPTPGWRQT